MYLLDTNVVSELRQTRSRKSHPNVLRWIGSIHEDSLYLSVMSVFELEVGALQIARRDPARASALNLWIEQQVLSAFAGRILSLDLNIARRCASLHVPDPRSYRDAFIAATALTHRLTMVTRNVADFAPTGVPILNPWDA